MRVMKPAVAIATATAMLGLAACGGGGSTGGSPSEQLSQGEGGGAGKGKDASMTGAHAVPSDASQGGTITILSNQVPATFDPTQAYYTDSTAILSLVTRALTQYVYDPEAEDMVLIPDMATDLGQPNADNTEWTFTLKKGLKYEDGSPVEAADVAYAVKRSFATKELPYGPTYNQTFFLDGDEYTGPFSDGEDYRGVEVDGRDITIKMTRPFAEMDYYASFPSFTAIPESEDDPETYGSAPVATGPYKFADYKAGSSLTLVKNDQWDPESDPGRIQAVDGWEFRFGEETAKLENVILNDNGSAQTTATYDNVTPATYRAMQEDKDRLVVGTSPCTYMWFLDNRKIDDIDVRRAIGYAFPYEDYWKSLGEVVGLTRIPGTSLLPPGTDGRATFDPLGNKGIQTDVAKAKDLLKKAGEENFEVKFYYETDDPLSVESKNQIVEGLEKAGFKATAIASTDAKRREQEAEIDSPVNVRSSGWCSDWPTGGSWFPAQWDGDLVDVEGVPNPSFFNEPEADQRQDKILDDTAPEEAAAAWGKFDQYLMETYYPAVNLGYSGTAMIHGSKIGGMANDTLRGVATFAEMYIKK